MAGDRRATAGNVIVTDRVEKIIEIDPTSLLGHCGCAGDGFRDGAHVTDFFRVLSPQSITTAQLAGARPGAGAFASGQSADDDARHWGGRAVVRRCRSNHVPRPATDLLLRSAGRANFKQSVMPRRVPVQERFAASLVFRNATASRCRRR